jgi:hypothetical protein
MLGDVVSGHDTEAFAFTPAVEQLSLPVAVTVLSTEQVLAGAVNVAEKLVDAPGARLGTDNTMAGVVLSFETFTLFSVTLPVFRTVPVKVIGPPAAAVVDGQTSVTAIADAVVVGQVGAVTLVTGACVHWSLPCALKDVVMEQTSAGTATLLVKVAEAPGARLAIVKTGVLGDGRSLTTTTSVRVMLPPFKTVPR